MVWRGLGQSLVLSPVGRMNGVLAALVLVVSSKYVVVGRPDLVPAAITVYRNPEFFKNLNYDTKSNYDRKSGAASEGGQERYKYPGETKKPNAPPASPGFEVNYDNSPEFHHEPRDIFVNTAHTPSRKKGPYSPRYSDADGDEPSAKPNVVRPVQEARSEEEGSRESRESAENSEGESGEEPRDLVSDFKETSEEEFRSYHEPILLARPNFDPAERSGVASSAYSQPYPYNRTAPLLFDDWKFYTYPKIHANRQLKYNPTFYSQEPFSNSFEDDPSYYRYDDEAEDASSIFEEAQFKNLGADTKHIYKKLLKPKSFLFKFHSKPKFKKLKVHLRKHPLKKDWFDEYPFNF